MLARNSSAPAVAANHIPIKVKGSAGFEIQYLIYILLHIISKFKCHNNQPPSTSIGHSCGAIPSRGRSCSVSTSARNVAQVAARHLFLCLETLHKSLYFGSFSPPQLWHPTALLIMQQLRRQSRGLKGSLDPPFCQSYNGLFFHERSYGS